jgi:hypothetical protein
MRIKKFNEDATPVTVVKTVVCLGKNGSADRTFRSMQDALHRMDIGSVVVREKILLITPVYVVAQLILTYGHKKPIKMTSYGISRRGWRDKADKNVGISTAMGRARKAAVKKLRRRIQQVGAWYEA